MACKYPRCKLRRKSGGLMASVERKPMVGIWYRSQQRGPEAEPLVFLLIVFYKKLHSV